MFQIKCIIKRNDSCVQLSFWNIWLIVLFNTKKIVRAWTHNLFIWWIEMFMIISHFSEFFNIKGNLILLYPITSSLTNAFDYIFWKKNLCPLPQRKMFQVIYTFFWFRLFFSYTLCIKESNISGCDTNRVRCMNRENWQVMLKQLLCWKLESGGPEGTRQKKSHKNILKKEFK